MDIVWMYRRTGKRIWNDGIDAYGVDVNVAGLQFVSRDTKTIVFQAGSGDYVITIKRKAS